MVFTVDDVARLRVALVEVEELKAFVARRTEFYVRMTTGEVVELRNVNGWAVVIANYELFNPDVEFVNVIRRDNQYGGDHGYKVPREFLFGPVTQEEKDFTEFLRLQEQFGKK